MIPVATARTAADAGASGAHARVGPAPCAGRTGHIAANAIDVIIRTAGLSPAAGVDAHRSKVRRIVKVPPDSAMTRKPSR